LPRTVIVERTPLATRSIEACQDCHAVCVESIMYCLEKGGAHADPQHLTLLRDCADLCGLSEDFLLRSSDLMNEACQVCADACEKCAESCDQFGDDDAMGTCAEHCRSCADACREMATGGELHNRLTSFS
jgi:hypothetical protein